MKVVPGDPAWVAARIPHCARGFGECTALGVEHRGRMVAGMVYHNWEPEFGVIEMSGAADDKRWMTKSVIHEFLAYPFSFCAVVMARHDPGNPARSIWLRIGATETEIEHGRGLGRPLVLATLTKPRWLESKWCRYGQEQRTEAA